MIKSGAANEPISLRTKGAGSARTIANRFKTIIVTMANPLIISMFLFLSKQFITA
jgi:hypothetical protein